MAIPLNDNISVQANKPQDPRYHRADNTPWTSVAEVNAGISAVLRYPNLTVSINGTEYWYHPTIADGDLVAKVLGGGVTEHSALNLDDGTNPHGTTASDVGALESGDNISELVNDSGYLTSVSESDVTQHEAALTITESQISDLSHFTPSNLLTDYGFTDNSTDWNVAYDNHIVDIEVTGTTTKTITLTQQDGGTLTANFNDLSGIGADGNDFLSSVTFNNTTGDLTFQVTGQPNIVESIDGRYSLLNHTHVKADITDFNDADYATAAQGALADSALQSGDNISELTNDSGYISSYTVTELDVTQHESAITITESQISDLSHFTPSNLLTDYGFTDNSTDWNTAYDNHIVGVSVSGTTTKTITLTQQDGGTLTANFTDISGAGGDGNDYLNGGSFNTSNGELTLNVLNQSDVVVDLDGRYADAATNTGDEVQATESVQGIAEIATNAETIAESDNTRIITPSKLGAWWSNIKTTVQTITNIWKFNGIDLETSIANPTHQEGRMYYDQEYGLSYYNEVSDMSIQVGKETLVEFWNDTGSTITNGTVVSADGTVTGLYRNAVPAIADSTFAGNNPIGVATHDVPDGTKGYATSIGRLGMDLSSFNVGDILYLSHTVVGGLSNTKPPVSAITADPNYVVEIGQVVTNTVNGILSVRVHSARPVRFDLVGNLDLEHNGGQALTGTYTELSGLTITLPPADLYEVLYSGWMNIGSDDKGSLALFADGVEIGGSTGRTYRQYGVVTSGGLGAGSTSDAGVSSKAQFSVVGGNISLSVRAYENTGTNITTGEASLTIKKYLVG